MKPVYLWIFIVMLLWSFPWSAYAQLSDQEICSRYQQLSKQAPIDQDWIYDYTKRDGMDVLCEHKIINYKARINKPFSLLKKGWHHPKQDQWNKLYCKEPTLSIIQQGWRIVSSVTFSDGQIYRFVANCTS